MDDIQLNELQESLYQSLGGDKVGTRKEFYDELVSDDNLRRTLYNDIGGRKVGTYAEFIDELGFKVKPAKSSGSTPKETIPSYTEPQESLRQKRVQEITNKYDKDREQISYSLYNEGVDRKKAKATVEPTIQMPQDVLKTPDLGKAKFVKDWTDTKLARSLSIDDVLTLNPEEAYRITKGKHKIDVDNEVIESVSGLSGEMAKDFAKDWINTSYSINFVLGNLNPVSNVFEYEARIEKQKEALLRADAVKEILIKNQKTKYLSNYGELLKMKEAELEEEAVSILTPEELNAYTHKEEYENKVNANTIDRNPQYEELLTSATTKLTNSGIFERGNSIQNKKNEVRAELDKLPLEYKMAALAEKAGKRAQSLMDTAFETTKTIDARNIMGIRHALMGALERNIFKGIPSFFGGVMAGAGIPLGEAMATVGSDQPNLWDFTSSVAQRATFEKTAIYYDDRTGEEFEIGFSDKGDIVGIYNKYGNIAKLSDSEAQRISQDVQDAELSKKAERSINSESLTYKATSMVLDVLALVVGSKGTLAASKAAGTIAKSMNLANKIPGATKIAEAVGEGGNLHGVYNWLSSGMLQVPPIAIQMSASDIAMGIREGGLTPQEASWYWGIDALKEITIEGINPMFGRIAKGMGRIDITSDVIKRRNLLSLLNKYPTKLARRQAGLTFLKEEGAELFEEGLSLYATPVLNAATNDILGGTLATGAPTTSEILETAVFTPIATFIPATWSARNDFSYLTSDRFFKESLYMATDAKNIDYLTAHLDEFENNKIIKPEERKFFDGMVSDIAPRREALEKLGTDSDKAKLLRQDILGGYAFKYALEDELSAIEKLGTDSDKAKQLRKQIEETQTNIEASIKGLENIPQQVSTPEGFATKPQDFEGKSGDIMGEDNISLTQAKEEVPAKYFNSHGELALWSEIKELEVKERKNYTNKDFKEWEKKYGIKPDDQVIWVTPDKKGAVTYMASAEEHDAILGMNEEELATFIKDNNLGDVAEFSGDEGVIIKESDDGDNGFLFVIKNTQQNDTNNVIPVQKQGTNEEVLLNEQSELGLREVGKGDQKSEEIAQETQEKENPLNLDMTKLDPKNPAGILETIKTKLKADGILTFEDDVTKQPC